MTKKSRTVLTLQAQQIQTEVSEKANTNLRIGVMDQDIVDSMVHQDDPATFTSVDIVYADVAAMLSLQAQQTPKNLYRVDNAADGGLVGYAYYEYLGGTTPSLADYKLVSSENLPPPAYFDMADQGATSPAYAEGRFWYGNNSFNIYDNIEGTSIQVGKEVVIDMYNGNGTTLTNFTVVRYGPAVGGFPAATRAQADTTANANSFGVCTHDILVTGTGKVTTQGLAGGDTSAWNANDILYLSATAPGEMTNIEQPILKPVARVLVAGTEVNGGSIYVFQQGVINVTALGQAGGADEIQLLTATPNKLEVYDANKFEQNVDVTQVGAGPYTAEMSPASVGAGGFYRVSFSISVTASGNTQHIFEVYINGAPTGQLGVIDCTNNNIDSGSTSFSSLTQVAATVSDVVEVYAYVAATTSTIAAASVTLNIERIGNV